MHHIEDCNLCGVDWCKKVDQGVCVNFSLNDGTHALGPGISEVGCDALEDTTPYCIDGSDAIYGVGTRSWWSPPPAWVCSSGIV